MSDATKAVFLSYAREDTDAARRIADALRAFGVEVWFDQSELRGGDTWDSKIKKQIRECALFVPLVSKQTQERHEGYFRREWLLAVERTRDMAHGRAFIVPVVIDETREADAAVPEEFMRYQWTRLAHGVPSPQFVEQVKRLLESPRKPAAGVRTTSVAHGGAAPRSSGFPVWLAAVVGVVLIGAVAYFALRPAAKEPATALKSAAPSSIAPSPAPTAAAAAKSIAVLPFANFSPEKDNEFFADGLHDEVITALTKIHDLKVISRTSVMAYRNPEGRNLKKIAAELGVATILEGSVQRAGSKVHLNVQLIDARTDDHLWADSYTKDLTDVFSVQSELAAAVTSALKATLSSDEKSLIARRPTQNQEAYDLFLRARILATTGELDSRQNLDRIVSLYEEAIARDPAFTLAHVQLALTHCRLYWFGYLDPTPARLERAKAERDAAVRLAPDAPETRLAVGYYAYACENDWARALAEFRAAEAGLPNDAQVAYGIAIAQRRLGRLPEALATFTRSVELNPRDITAPPELTQTLLALRHYAAARDVATRSLTVFPDDARLQGDLAAAQLELDHDIAAYLKRLEAKSVDTSDPQGLAKPYILAMARGDLAAADRALADARLTSIPSSTGVINSPAVLERAFVAFLRGRRDSARTLADEAIPYFRTRKWTLRQEPSVMMATALAHALAGRPDEAVQLARDALSLDATRDAFTALVQQINLGRVYLVLDRRAEALAVLKEMMTGPCPIGPERIRLDPVWSRLKDDPRFEEILKSAKPL